MELNQKNYKLGSFVFSKVGSCSLASLIEDELKSIESKENNSPQLVFNFKTVDKINIDQVKYAKPVEAWRDGFIVDGGGLIYSVTKKEKCKVITVQRKAQKSWKAKIKPMWFERARDWNYLTYEETVAKNFMYNVFDYLVQIEQLKNGQSFIHASSFCKSNMGVGIFAWGGIGKTTSMLKMIIEDNWKFLSDDLGVIDKNGIIWRSPKKMQVYAYNTKNQNGIYNRLMRGRSLLDVTAWHWRRIRSGVDRVRRRVSAEQFLGVDSVASHCPIVVAIFAERTNNKDFCFEKIIPEEFSYRSAAIVMQEIEPYSQILRALEGQGYYHLLPSYSGLMSSTQQVIFSGIANAQTWLWRIPSNANPDAIYNSLKTHLKTVLN